MSEIHYGIIAIGVQLITAIAAYQYLVHREDGKCQLSCFFAPKFDFSCLLLMLVAFFASAYIFLRGFLLDGGFFVRALTNAEVFLWLMLLGYVDFKERIIPNPVIGVGLLYWLVQFLLQVFLEDANWAALAKTSLIGGFVCGGILLLIAIIVKTALGMGDVKMFFVLGLLYGFADVYGILLFSMVVMGVVSIILLIAKKVTSKTAIPMAPFVVVGFFLSILAGL